MLSNCNYMARTQYPIENILSFHCAVSTFIRSMRGSSECAVAFWAHNTQACRSYKFDGSLNTTWCSLNILVWSPSDCYPTQISLAKISFHAIDIILFFFVVKWNFFVIRHIKRWYWWCWRWWCTVFDCIFVSQMWQSLLTISFDRKIIRMVCRPSWTSVCVWVCEWLARKETSRQAKRLYTIFHTCFDLLNFHPID